MKIISITGTSSETGKTTVGAFIIKELKNICALKITVQHEGTCPRHRDDSCDGCSPEENSLFKIITDPAILAQPGKDTARYIEAGATKVVWLQTSSECADEGISRALNLFDDDARVLIEGNRFLALRDADLGIMVVSPGLEKIKRSALEVLKKVDLFIINKRPGVSKELIESTKVRLKSMGCKSHIIVLDPYNPDLAAEDTLLLNKIREVLDTPVGITL
ncbi:MAG: hypothetical protein AABZ62_02010 [Planctomycetota bacterium]